MQNHLQETLNHPDSNWLRVLTYLEKECFYSREGGQQVNPRKKEMCAPLGEREHLGPGNEPVLKKTIPTAHAYVLGPQKQETVNNLIIFNSAYSKYLLCYNLVFWTYLQRENTHAGKAKILCSF